jgi:hypothetical protein
MAFCLEFEPAPFYQGRQRSATHSGRPCDCHLPGNCFKAIGIVSPMSLRLSERAAEWAMAAALVVVAIAISPIGIRLATGRLDLSPRINVLSLTFDAILLILAGAIVARGRAKPVFFHLLLWSLPLALLAALETGAIALNLAHRIAPIEDLSLLANKSGWPPHLMSVSRRITVDGVVLYRPWQGDGISINELGLRTAMPSPKAPGEWRIAVSGASSAFGWRLRDADTIPVQLQQILRSQGHTNVTVYNFAVDAMLIANEVALLQRFRELYGIDQVVFYTGANDATDAYMGGAAPLHDDLGGLLSGVNAFELIKVAGHLQTKWLGPSSDLLAEFDNRILPELTRRNTLKDGLIAAGDYCRGSALRCDVVLQPVLLARSKPRGPEIALARSLGELYPRYREVFATMYRSASGAGLPIHDRSDMFAQSAEPYFIDIAHVNEAGNKYAAERIAEVVSRTIPAPGQRSDQ